MSLVRKVALAAVWLTAFVVSGALLTATETSDTAYPRVHAASGDAWGEAVVIATLVAFAAVAVYSIIDRKLHP